MKTIAPSKIDELRRIATRWAKFSLWILGYFIPLNIVVVLVAALTKLPTKASGLLQIIASLLLFVVGFAAGCFALSSTRHCGRNGIWGRAIVGVTLTGLALVFFAWGLVSYVKVWDYIPARN